MDLTLHLFPPFLSHHSHRQVATLIPPRRSLTGAPQSPIHSAEAQAPPLSRLSTGDHWFHRPGDDHAPAKATDASLYRGQGHLGSSRSASLARCCSTQAFVVADDHRYGNKKIISITPQLYNYILNNIREPEILRKLREETALMPGGQMQVSPDQAQLLAMLVQILGAERCIEVGVYTGRYSSLAVALALPDSGCLVACERDPKALEVATRYYSEAGVLHKVKLEHGLAKDSLESMLLNGEAGSYDFAFIDAEKRMYREYFELVLKLVRVGGVIVIDNVLWHGKVADPLAGDAKTLSLREFNKAVIEDERVSISIVPIGDGMTICRKR